MADVIQPPKDSFQSRIKARYFATRRDTVITVVFAALVAWVLWSLIDWALLNATFAPNAGDICREDLHGGACWSVVSTRWRIVLFGLY
ncbi:MAG: hypothetical protein OXE84_13160, partial [Rhodobacteraceae bacterium]|nr:hypothetical protein [Paracoccaceae bacterium]